MTKPKKRSSSKRAHSRNRRIALYHVVFNYETFEDAAQMIFKIIQKAEQMAPGQPRHLYLDIDGHRNEAGGFDHDMFELQREFLMGFLMPFLSEVYGPLWAAKNPEPQRNDLPPELVIAPAVKRS